MNMIMKLGMIVYMFVCEGLHLHKFFMKTNMWNCVCAMWRCKGHGSTWWKDMNIRERKINGCCLNNSNDVKSGLYGFFCKNNCMSLLHDHSNHMVIHRPFQRQFQRQFQQEFCKWAIEVVRYLFHLILSVTLAQWRDFCHLHCMCLLTY